MMLFRQSLRCARGFAAAVACLSALLGPILASGAQSRDEGVPAAAPLSSYAGSAACRECHAAQYAHWSGEAMASFVQLRDAAGQFARVRQGGPVDKADVFVVVGVKRKLAFVGRDWMVLPYDFNLDKGKWRENSDWRGADYRTQCGPCHLTAVVRATAEFKEMNVGCEVCHGPGRRHVETQSTADTLVPGKAGAEPAVATCRRCHNDRNRHNRAIQGWEGPYHPR